jgi:hypothetical protein
MKSQTLDMVLRPVPKGATTVSSLTSATPIRVTGPLSGPSYMPEADAILQKAVGGLLSPGQKINTGVPRVEGVGGATPCVTAINNPQPIMVDPPKTEQIFKDVRDTVKDNYKNVKDLVKNPGGIGNLLKGGQPATAQPAPNGQAAPSNQKPLDALKGLLGK